MADGYVKMDRRGCRELNKGHKRAYRSLSAVMNILTDSMASNVIEHEQIGVTEEIIDHNLGTCLMVHWIRLLPGTCATPSGVAVQKPCARLLLQLPTDAPKKAVEVKY